MTRSVTDSTDRAWERLEVYRDRYDIEDRIEAVASLQKSMLRRADRLAALNRRGAALHRQLEEIDAEIAAVTSELEGSRRAGALLIEEILDDVARDQGERWSPVPIKGFRVWRIQDSAVMGSQVPWHSATITSKCLRSVSGEDVPHSGRKCGPPACGVYAVKSLEMFPDDLTGGLINHSVVGVVALSGKVIEHTDGYRGERATAVAICATHQGRQLASNQPALIEEFFADPETTMQVFGAEHSPDPITQRAFLTNAEQQEMRWI